MAGTSETVKDKSKITSDNETSEKGYVTDDIDDEDSECKRKHKMNKLTVFSKVNGKLQVKPASSTKCKKIGKIPGHSNTTLKTKYEDSDDDGDILIYSSEDDIDNTADMAEDTKKDGPTVMETPSVKFARIVFDATDMNKGCKTMKIKTDATMRDIKKLFPKHLSVTEDNFMLFFNNQEVEEQTPLQLFGDNLEGDHNVIKIVKSIKIRLGGEPFPKKGLYLDERPNTPFSEIRQKIAGHLKEPPALIGLVYNDKDILNDQTPESVKMVHGDVLKVFKTDKMKIRFKGSIFNEFDNNLHIDINPNTTMRKMKSVISRSVKIDQRRIMLIYKDRFPSDQDTPVNLGMSDTDILFANFGVAVTIKGPVGDTEEFYPGEKPLKELFQTYTEMHQMANSAGKRVKSFVFRFNGNIVHDEDTAKSLNMVDGDCIIACEVLTKVFKGSSEHKYNNYEQNQEESLSNEDFDFPGTPPNYKHNHVDEQNSDERKRDIEKKLKALQMRLNRDKKKKGENGVICLAKDIPYHKDFENMDDILKFIGEEDSTSNTPKKNKHQVGSSKGSKSKKKKKIEKPTTCNESDKKEDAVSKLEIQDSDRTDNVVSTGQNDIRDNKLNEILNDPDEDKKDPRNKQSINGRNKIDVDGGKSIENSKHFKNAWDISNLIQETDEDSDSTAKTTEGNNVKVRSSEMNLNRKETDNKDSDKIDKSVTDSTMDDFQDEVQRSKGNDRGDEQSKMKDVKKKVRKQKSFAITKISQLNSKLAIFESEAEVKKEQLEEIECMIGELKSKLALFKCEAEAMEEQLEEDRMPANVDPKYLVEENPEYQNAKTSNEQEIQELVKRIEERRALFNKVESIQVEGVPNHVLGNNVENGQHEVKEAKKDCGEKEQHEINEETKDIRKQKKEKVIKPYCARASCPNKGEHKCSRCKAVFYCHQDCLNEDWPHHKMICDYVYKANKLPRDSTSKTLSQIEKACGREEVD